MNSSQEISEIIKSELSKMSTNVTKTTVNKMLLDIGIGGNLITSMNNGSMPRSDNLGRIAQFLNISTDYLLGLTPHKLTVDEYIKQEKEVEKHPAEKEISKNLRCYRERRQITENELADKLGVSEGTVCRWEDGISPIDAGSLYKLCKLLDVSVNDIYGEYANAPQEEYTQTEREMIADYRDLNKQGREKVIENIDDLLKSGKYIKTDKFRLENKKQA